jgi:hypothetical protein
MQNIQVQEMKGEAPIQEKKVPFKKTLSDKEFEKSINNNNIGFVNMANSTKNTSKKIINYNIQSANEFSNKNNKKFFIKLPEKDKFLLDTDRSPQNRENSQFGEFKPTPINRDIKIPMTNTSLNKHKIDIKLPNSTRAAESKITMDPNLFSSLNKKDAQETSKVIKKISKK